MPVIHDVSYRNGIRPSRPMTVSVVQSGVALAASPVSAAMAAMLTLTDVGPFNLGLTQILVDHAAGLHRRHRRDVVRRRPDGPGARRRPGGAGEDPFRRCCPPIGAPTAAEGAADGHAATTSVAATADRDERGSQRGADVPRRRRRDRSLRPLPRLAADVRRSPERRTSRLDMTSTIVIVMFVVGAVIVFVGRPQVKLLPEQSVFKAGMVAAIALFGIAWMTATFIEANEALIVDTVGGWIDNYKFVFALSVFVVAALTTSQSTATRTMVPIGLAAGLAPGLLTGMWGGAVGGVYSLPSGGPQIAGANFDLSGTTKLGTKLFDHSYFVPMLILTGTTTLVGSIIGAVFF